MTPALLLTSLLITTGTVETLISDKVFDGQLVSDIWQQVLLDDGTTTPLPKQYAGLPPGTKVDITAGVVTVIEEPEPMAAEGERRAVVIVVDFLDADVLCTDADIENMMWFSPGDNHDELYQQASYGTLSFPPDSNNDGDPDLYRVGIPHSTDEVTYCDYGTWSHSADSLVPTDLSIYQHKMYIFPYIPQCGTGLGSVGCGDSCRHWSWRCNEAGPIIAHETGHNLGMRHSTTDLNNDGIIDYEYGDNSCTMGGRWWLGYRRFNAPHAEQMGWINVEAVTGLGSSVHTLHAIGSESVEVLKVPQHDGVGWYYVSYRNNDGYDATMPAAYAEKVSVHRYSLDTSGGVVRTYLVDVLDVGDTFVDAGVFITMLSHDGDVALVEVVLSEMSGGGPPLEGESGGAGTNQGARSDNGF